MPKLPNILKRKSIKPVNRLLQESYLTTSTTTSTTSNEQNTRVPSSNRNESTTAKEDKFYPGQTLEFEEIFIKEEPIDLDDPNCEGNQCNENDFSTTQGGRILEARGPWIETVDIKTESFKEATDDDDEDKEEEELEEVDEKPKILEPLRRWEEIDTKSLLEAAIIKKEMDPFRGLIYGVLSNEIYPMHPSEILLERMIRRKSATGAKMMAILHVDKATMPTDLVSVSSQGVQFKASHVNKSIQVTDEDELSTQTVFKKPASRMIANKTKKRKKH